MNWVAAGGNFDGSQRGREQLRWLLSSIELFALAPAVVAIAVLAIPVKTVLGVLRARISMDAEPAEAVAVVAVEITPVTSFPTCSSRSGNER